MQMVGFPKISISNDMQMKEQKHFVEPQYQYRYCLRTQLREEDQPKSNENLKTQFTICFNSVTDHFEIRKSFNRPIKRLSTWINKENFKKLCSFGVIGTETKVVLQ